MNCAICQKPMKLIPAGVSQKNNKPYSAFYACEDRNHKQPRNSAQNAPNQALSTPNKQNYGGNDNKMTKEDWDNKSFGMCKHAFLIEAFKINLKLSLAEKISLNELETEAEIWATMSMRKLNELKEDEQGNNYVEGEQPPF